MKKALLAIDMQNDFIDGALGSKEAQAIVDKVLARVKSAKESGETIYFSKDTHGADYLKSPEGQKLPVPHCLKGEGGHELSPLLKPFEKDAVVFEKPYFGLSDEQIKAFVPYDKITVLGLCTDICVIVNALRLRVAYPDKEIVVEKDCCAGITTELHDAALKVMASCQLDII